MTVSVVIATYNRAAMVRQAIQAVLAQSRPAGEIVVLDDASADATWAELSALAEAHPQLRIHRRTANSGGVASWNQAAACAAGDLIAFCADDDRFLERHIERSCAYLEQHPETGLVHSGFIDAVECGGTETFEVRPLRSSMPLRMACGTLLPYMVRYYDWPFHASTLVLRREVWEATGGFDTRFSLPDTDWFVRAVERFPAVLLPYHGVYNRRHPGNWSNRLGSAHMQREIFEIVEELIARRYGGRALRRAAWRAAWRADVRLHLLLTLAARLRSAHLDAALTAWRGMLHHTGRRPPAGIERWGEALIRRACQGRAERHAGARESVSPL